MCLLSYVGDTWREKIPESYPWIVPDINTNPIIWPPAAPSQEEFDALKRDVEKMKEELIKAKIIDEENGEPDCEMEEKVKFIKEIAKAVGVDLEEVFGSDNV